jgi:SPX domain protein involved in polyphosphate accumulation
MDVETKEPLLKLPNIDEQSSHVTMDVDATIDSNTLFDNDDFNFYNDDLLQ